MFGWLARLAAVVGAEPVMQGVDPGELLAVFRGAGMAGQCFAQQFEIRGGEQCSGARWFGTGWFGAFCFGIGH